MYLSTRIPHKKREVSKLKIFSYYFLLYGIMLAEKIMVIPYTMIFFRSFICGTDQVNIAQEFVSSSFTSCWTIKHICFFCFALFSAFCFYGLLLSNILILSLNYMKSPLPWSDENFLNRLLILIFKILIAIELVFDPEVNFN